MSYQSWLAKYQPIKNPFNPEAPFGGTLFRRRGEDFSLVRECPLKHIWSVADIGDGDYTIFEGAIVWECCGHFITKVPAPDGRAFLINLPKSYYLKD